MVVTPPPLVPTTRLPPTFLFSVCFFLCMHMHALGSSTLELWVSQSSSIFGKNEHISISITRQWRVIFNFHARYGQMSFLFSQRTLEARERGLAYLLLLTSTLYSVGFVTIYIIIGLVFDHVPVSPVNYCLTEVTGFPQPSHRRTHRGRGKWRSRRIEVMYYYQFIMHAGHWERMTLSESENIDVFNEELKIHISLWETHFMYLQEM